MKKIVLPILMALCLLGFQEANAQIDLTVNPVGALFGDFNIGADFGLSRNFSVEAQVGVGINKIADVKGFNIPVNVVGKYYLSPNRGADRFYVDAFLRFINRNWNYNAGSGNADYTSTRIGIGFGLGYKIVAAKGFVFDIGLGAGRALVTNNKFRDSNGNQQELDWPNVMIIGKFGIGYRFGGSKD